MANLIAQGLEPAIRWSTTRDRLDWVLQSDGRGFLSLYREGASALLEAGRTSVEAVWSDEELQVNERLLLAGQAEPELTLRQPPSASGQPYRFKADAEALLLQTDAAGGRVSLLEVADRRVYVPNGMAAGHQVGSTSQVIRWSYQTGQIRDALASRTSTLPGFTVEVPIPGTMHLDAGADTGGDVIAVTVMLQTPSPPSADEADDLRFDVYDSRAAEQASGSFTVEVERRAADSGGDRIVIAFDVDSYDPLGEFHVLVFSKAAGVTAA